MPATPSTSPRPDRTATLAGADWLSDERLRRLMRLIADAGEDIRVVGGAVRNALMGLDIADVDLATTAHPQTITDLTRAAGMKPVPTGIDHGTVTVVVDGKPYEVTTLREDVSTDGRRATVKFGRDWSADAMRRDFTVNALYATATGEIVDLVGGVQDCLDRHIRFIGDPDARIREDYLRILRFFRFHATFCDGPMDEAGLHASIRLRDGILHLSAERIGQEMAKLVVAASAPAVLRTMQDTGILALALGIEADIDHFARLKNLLHTVAAIPTINPLQNGVPLLLASLTHAAEGCERLTQRLRLSNAVRDRMIAASSMKKEMKPDMSDRDVRAAIFRAGRGTFRDALLLGASTVDPIWPADSVARLLRLSDTFVPPAVPVTGRDLLAIGLVAGPDVGRILDRLTQDWIASDFSLAKADLLATVTRPGG